MSFEKLGLSPTLCETLSRLKFEIPTPIQSAAIPHVLCGRDLLGTAQTGTGKTASFLLPLIEILSQKPSKARMPRAIVVEPTRELALQVMNDFENFTQDLSLKAVVLVGGESMTEQDRLLKRQADVIIATPGRLLDLHERGKLMFAGIKHVVIDEADQMLDMGFMPDVNRLMSLLPRPRQTLLFSATIAQEIKKLVETYLLNPKKVTVEASQKTASTITQYKAFVDDHRKKNLAVRNLVRALSPRSPVIIFCNKKDTVDQVVSSLKKREFKVLGLHSNMHQRNRTETMSVFKGGDVHILVASNVAARGLDVKDVGLVINLEVPQKTEDYIHRIGRTGRAGRTGHAVTLVTESEIPAWEKLHKKLGHEILEYPGDVLQKEALDPFYLMRRSHKGLGFGENIAPPHFFTITVDHLLKKS